MSYPEQEIDEISRSRSRLRCYFWKVAQNARRTAAENRRTSRANKATFDEGRDLIKWAGVLERVSAIVLDNIDALVESTYEGE